MGLLKEWWFAQQYEDEAPTSQARSEAAESKAQAAEQRLRQERDWAASHPVQWAEWIRLQPLLEVRFDFGNDRQYDFPQFLADVGQPPSPAHQIVRKDKTRPFGEGNVDWGSPRKQETQKFSSPYLDVNQAAAYCHLAKQTIYNRRWEIERVPGTRKLLFRRETLDQWLTSRLPRRRR